MVFAVGTFITTTPFLLEFSISTLSTPTPARTTARNFVADSKKLISTSVELLVIATSALYNSFFNSSLGKLAKFNISTSMSFDNKSKPL